MLAKVSVGNEYRSSILILTTAWKASGSKTIEPIRPTTTPDAFTAALGFKPPIFSK